MPKSEAVAPRYSWESGTTAQSPFRCSDVLPPSRMSSANNVLAREPSLRGRRGRRRDPGKAKDSIFPCPSSCPKGSPTQFSIRSNHWKTCKCCIWLHVVPIRMSSWMTDDDPLTKIDNAAALSTNEATENSGTGPGSSRARPKDQPLRTDIRHHVLTEGVTVFVCTPEDLASGSNRIDATIAPRLP